LPNEDLKYAAHGGLIVITRKPKLLPSKFYTTLTVGRVQCIFYYQLTLFEIWEMQLRYPRFIAWCAENARSAIDNPIPQSDLERLGL
jgi:hypothetical protein